MPDELLRQRALDVHRRLIQVYGEPVWEPDGDAVGELVSTILSQNTNDTNRDRAYVRMREQFPTWEAVRDADLDALKEAIQVAGLANHKAPAIQRALRHIAEQRGELSLDFLKAMSPAEAKAWLMAIKGVGPKTAAIVLLFSLGMPAFPVDTHIHRVARRLGLIGPQIGREQAHGLLEAMMPPEAYYPFHLNVIHHGREICGARSPRCEICVLREVCEYARTMAGGRGPREP